MRRVLAAALVAAACAPASAGPRAAVLGPPGENRIPTERCGDYFIVETRIDGSGPYRLILDTGARTVLDESIARTTAIGDRADSLSAGPFRARDVDVVVRDMEDISLALGSRVDGILGYDAFHGVLLILDYPGNEVRVAEGRLPREGPGITETIPGRSRPFLRARIGGRTVPVLLDSGAGGLLSLRGLDRLGTESAPRVVGAVTRIDGVFLNRAGRLQHDVDLGVLLLRRPVAAEARGVDLVGQRLLRDYTVVFDRVGNRVRFIPPPGRTVDTPPVWDIGVALRPAEGGWVVRWMAEDSPAAATGLQLNDTVVARNGRRFDRLECRVPFRAPEGSGMTSLVVSRGGEEIEVPVPRVLLVP